MIDRICDFFVESLILLFMPLVCGYYALCDNPFLNVSIKEATGLEKAGNTLLTPFQYLFAGQEATQNLDGTWTFNQRFDYESYFWVKATASTISLPPSLVLGSLVKGAAFLTQDTQNRNASLIAYQKSSQTKSQIETYRALGIDVQDTDQAAYFISQQYARRPGDEKHLQPEKEALAQIGKILTEAKIPWWVDCGTCLGTYRYGGVIPWDGDIDVAVLLPDFENVRKALNQLDPDQYIVQNWSGRDRPYSYLKVYVRETGNTIDIYHFQIDPETKTLNYVLSLENNLFFPSWWKIRESRFLVPASFEMVFPLKKALFDGVEVFIPNHPQKYLQRCYGENLAPAKLYNPATHYYEKDLSHPYWQRAHAH